MKKLTEFGLENMPGHLNCFLNVVLQAFWHLSTFKKDLEKFVQYDQFSDAPAVELPRISNFVESLKVIFSLEVHICNEICYRIYSLEY